MRNMARFYKIVITTLGFPSKLFIYTFFPVLVLADTPECRSQCAARSKEWICGRSLTRIVGSNPAEGMDVCLLKMLCVVR
jgi:hypothetical protein